MRYPLPWRLRRGEILDAEDTVVIGYMRDVSGDAVIPQSTETLRGIVAAVNAHAALLAAVRAGECYAKALRRYQDNGVRGQVIPGTDELDRLFMDWYEKAEAAIAKAEGVPA